MTILEVVISMLLLAIAVAGIYATFAVVGKGPRQGGTSDLRAINCARETLERLKNAVSAEAARSVPLNAGTNKSDPVTGGTYTRTYDVVDGPDSNSDGVPDYKKVTVTVKW
jgi:Tfp pilus assembly protein PilV